MQQREGVGDDAERRRVDHDQVVALDQLREHLLHRLALDQLRRVGRVRAGDDHVHRAIPAAGAVQLHG